MTNSFRHTNTSEIKLTSTATFGFGLALYWAKNKSFNRISTLFRNDSFLANKAQLSVTLIKWRQKLTVDWVKLIHVSPVTCDFMSIPAASSSRNVDRRFNFDCKLYGVQTFSVRPIVSIRRNRDSSINCSSVPRSNPSIWYDRSKPISVSWAHGLRTPSTLLATDSSGVPFVK